MKKFNKPVQKAPSVRSGFGVRTLPEMIDMCAERYSFNLAYLIPRNNNIYKLSYGQVLQYVKHLGRYLKELGLERGDHIAILGENRPEWAISYFSVAWIGSTAIPLDARASPDAHKFILGFSSSKAVIVSSSHLAHIQPLKDELLELKHIIVMDNFDEIYSKYSIG